MFQFNATLCQICTNTYFKNAFNNTSAVLKADKQINKLHVFK